MGSPKGESGHWAGEAPRHRVSFAQAFAVGAHEVTFAEWDACVADGGCNGYRPDDAGWGRNARPVMFVNWTDAKAYANWLSQKTGLAYRLLSEAEWEYVARGGQTTPFFFGEKIATDQANFDGNFRYGAQTKGVYRQMTMPTGSFPHNAFGIHDAHGNVWEWVEDCWNESYEGAPSDGAAWLEGRCDFRVLRGGSWNTAPGVLRSAHRGRFKVSSKENYLGFRVARSVK
jgi:formylglycine-generating enzyme required for sulfatase activity